MRDTKRQRIARFYDSMHRLGIDYDIADRLRRIEMTLHKWAEHECGNSDEHGSYMIERDEETEKPYWVRIWHRDGRTFRTPTADREKGALKRLSKIMENFPTLTFYHQTDPRGCALWLVERERLGSDDISSVYTRGIAVCID